jgi:hypothetical protein
MWTFLEPIKSQHSKNKISLLYPRLNMRHPIKNTNEQIIMKHLQKQLNPSNNQRTLSTNQYTFTPTTHISAAIMPPVVDCMVTLSKWLSLVDQSSRMLKKSHLSTSLRCIAS